MLYGAILFTDKDGVALRWRHAAHLTSPVRVMGSGRRVLAGRHPAQGEGRRLLRGLLSAEKAYR